MLLIRQHLELKLVLHQYILLLSSFIQFECKFTKFVSGLKFKVKVYILKSKYGIYNLV
jgi:hypothetical protein